MSKFFAVYLPILAVLMTTLVIVLLTHEQLQVSRKTMLVFLGAGVLVFLLVYGFLLSF